MQSYIERANIRSSTVSACERLRLSPNAIPTEENRRSTAAELAGTRTALSAPANLIAPAEQACNVKNGVLNVNL